MRKVNIGERMLEVDNEGYLINFDDWSEDVANVFAEADNLQLTEEHWIVVNYLREYYHLYHIAPMITILIKEIRKVYGIEKGNSRYLYKLFPDGPARQACRYAGLPKPAGHRIYITSY